VRWRNGYLGTALVLRHDRPAPEYPVAHSEIIAAYVVRRRTRFGAVAFDLFLDEEFHVEAGRRLYHLPKELDPSLRIEVARDAVGVPYRMTAAGANVTFEADLRPTRHSRARGLVAAIFHALTERGLVIGALEKPALCASIAVRPDPETAFNVPFARFATRQRVLRPLYAQFWESMEITLRAPQAILERPAR
jgi:hypothetical protein